MLSTASLVLRSGVANRMMRQAVKGNSPIITNRTRVSLKSTSRAVPCKLESFSRAEFWKSERFMVAPPDREALAGAVQSSIPQLQPRACMLKSELIERIAEQNPHLYQRDVETIVNAILNTITTALARGDRVELRDFGMFTVKRRNARTAWVQEVVATP